MNKIKCESFLTVTKQNTKGDSIMEINILFLLERDCWNAWKFRLWKCSLAESPAGGGGINSSEIDRCVAIFSHLTRAIDVHTTDSFTFIFQTIEYPNRRQFFSIYATIWAYRSVRTTFSLPVVASQKSSRHCRLRNGHSFAVIMLSVLFWRNSATCYFIRRREFCFCQGLWPDHNPSVAPTNIATTTVLSGVVTIKTEWPHNWVEPLPSRATFCHGKLWSHWRRQL